MLTGPEIHRQVVEKQITIRPFDAARLNPNSYNLCIAPVLLGYRPRRWWTPWRKPLVWGRKNPVDFGVTMPKSGYVIRPGWFYLGSTAEWTETNHSVPRIDGRSTGGRLSLHVHATAGFGDVGFHGTWTLEIYSILPVVIFPYAELAQISYEPVQGMVESYKGRYQDQNGATPARTIEGEAQVHAV